jgi:hypothetical protein
MRPLFVLACVAITTLATHTAPYPDLIIVLAAVALAADYLFRVAKNR